MTRFELATVLTLVPAMAFADGAEAIELTRQMQGASLHAGGIDMVAYYLEHSDHYEVVATYVTDTNPDDPARLRMALTDGDSVRFALPGERHIMYGFARTGTTVIIEAVPTHSQVAAAN